MRLLTLTAILALAAAPALADTERAGFRGMMPDFDFQAADADGDGTLSRAEFTAHVEARIEAARDTAFDRRAAAIMDAGDADGDGLLSLEEVRAGLAAVHDARMERRATWRERAEQRRGDRGDKAGRMRGHRGMMRGDASQMIDRMFDRIDADGDGEISAEEFAQAQERWQRRADGRGQRHGD